MGIKGLTSSIKACPGVVEDLKTKTCHVDFPAMFFALLNARAFHATAAFEAKKARKQCSTEPIATVRGPEVIPKRPGSPEQFTDISSKGPLSKHPRLSSAVSTENDLDGDGSANLMATDTDDASSSILGKMQQLLQEQPAQIFLDSDGTVTTTQALSGDIVSQCFFKHFDA